MTRTLLSAACVAVLAFATPALAQPVDPDAGLPLPATPADPDAAPSTKERLTDIGLAIGDYLWSLTEESELQAGTWLTPRSGALQSGLAVRFTSRAIDAAVDVPLTEDAARAHRIRFNDVIAGRVLVDVKLDERKIEDERIRDELISAGYRFGEEAGDTIVRFQIKNFEEQPVDGRVKRYRAILEPSPLALEADDLASWIGVRWRMRLGIERAKVNRAGATRLNWGDEFELRLGEYSEMHVVVHVDSEVSVALDRDSAPAGLGRSVGMSNRVRVTMIEPGAHGTNPWSASFSVEDEREGGGGIKAGKNVLRRTTYTAEASFLVGADGIRLRPSLSLVRVRNSLNPNLAVDQTRFRAALEADLNEYFTVGAQLGRDLDGRTRPTVTAGVRIPLR